jgi:hypothetical protein
MIGWHHRRQAHRSAGAAAVPMGLPMQYPFRFAAVGLALALALAGCAKTAHDSTGTTTTTTITTTTDAAATTAPDATAAPDVAAAPPSGAPNAFIVVPVYPGASEMKDQGVSMTANGTSIAINVYSSPDDSKKIADWYAAHLPAGWTNHVLTSDGKTVGTFSSEGSDGNQSVIVTTTNGVTRVQIATKHGQ